MLQAFAAGSLETQSLRIREHRQPYADFVSGLGNIVGSYVSAAGTYPCILACGPGGSFATLDLPLKGELDYFFLHGLNDGLIAVGRAKPVGVCSAHLCRATPSTYKNCGFRIALAQRVGISIRTAPSSDTMTQRMDAGTDLSQDPLESTDPRTSNRRMGAPVGFTF